MRPAQMQRRPLFQAFTDHPQSVGETYLQHAAAAASFAALLIAAGMAALCHAVLPFTFKTTARRIIADLHARLEQR